VSITTGQAGMLLRQAGQYKFSQLGFNMLIGRLARQYSKNSSDAALDAYTKELNDFLTKYATAMSADAKMIAELKNGGALDA